MGANPFSQRNAAVEVERWTPSVCGLCSLGCGVDIGTRDNEIVAVRGRADNPVNRGRLGPKGLSQYCANHHRTRALYPMMRNRRGTLVRCTWDEAMEAIVDKFNEELILRGPDAVAIYNSGQLLLEEYYT